MSSAVKPSLATAAGILALVMWSSTIAVSGAVAGTFGALRAAAWSFTAAALLVLIPQLLHTHHRRLLFQMPRRYLLVGGALFIGYLTSFYLGIKTCRSGQQLVEAGLVNYLWTGMTVVLSVPLLRAKARPTLIPAVLLALTGVALAGFSARAITVGQFLENLRENRQPYLWMLAAATCWSLYTILGRRWAAHCRGNPSPLFTLIAGLLLLPLAEPLPALFDPSAGQWLALLFMGLFPGVLAYLFWDLGVRHGNFALLTSLSYFVPLVSTLLTCLQFHLPLKPILLVAALLLVAGAAACKWSIIPAEMPAPTPAPPAPAGHGALILAATDGRRA